MKDGQQSTATSGVPRRAPQRSESGDAIRRRIKSTATKMFIRHGYNGVTFLSLSKALGITHSLIHYHFRTKAGLAEEVLQDFATIGIEENQTIWADPDNMLFDKFVRARDRMYRRFVLFNPSGKMRHPTGLVSRFSMDAESLTPKLRRHVKNTQEKLDECVEKAVKIAIQRGELLPETPVKMVMLQISSILFVAGPTARYGWEFPRLDDHFHGALVTLMRAYGTKPALDRPWPVVVRRSNSRTVKTAGGA